jgi:hypothetical protein
MVEILKLSRIIKTKIEIYIMIVFGFVYAPLRIKLIP